MKTFREIAMEESGKPMYCVSVKGNCNGAFDKEDDAEEYARDLRKKGYSTSISYEVPWSGTRG